MEQNCYILKEVQVAELAKMVSTMVVADLKACNGASSINARTDEDELIGTKEACRILGCCSKTMQSYRNRKLFRVVMRGPKKAMYYKSEILAFREANTRKSRDNH